MKGLIVVAMVSAILLPTHSAAHGMGAAGMGRGVGFSGNFGRGPNRAGFGRKAMDSAGHGEPAILVNVWIWDGIVIGTTMAPITDTRLTMAKDIHLG